MKNAKKFIWGIAAATCLMLATGTANAQKFGFINSQELLSSMPETDSAQAKVVELTKELEEQFTAMRNEFATKSQDLSTNLNTLSEPVRKQKEKDLFALQTRIE